ncbi:MAG: sigma-70 family RNA polymerase sigma factor [Fibrobacter sp.]|nr:sigma-70 family RNA polymerase sigma factor [Fibrobacter sp.]
MEQINRKISELYKKYGYIIHGRCISILKDDAEAQDALQNVFLILLKQYDTIKDKEKIVPWLFTAATNYCFNRLRDKKKYHKDIEMDSLPVENIIEKKTSDSQLINLLVNTQDKKVRDIVYYTHIEKLDQQEIGKITGQSPATIRRYLRRFEESCRKMSSRLEGD